MAHDLVAGIQFLRSFLLYFPQPVHPFVFAVGQIYSLYMSTVHQFHHQERQPVQVLLLLAELVQVVAFALVFSSSFSWSFYVFASFFECFVMIFLYFDITFLNKN